VLVYGRVRPGPVREKWPGSSRPECGSSHALDQLLGLWSSTTQTTQYMWWPGTSRPFWPCTSRPKVCK